MDAPVLSVDTKKKERVGFFASEAMRETTFEKMVFDIWRSMTSEIIRLS